MHHPEWEFTFGGIYNSSGNTAGMAAITAWKENAVDGDYAGALSLQTTPNGGAPTEKVRIASNGNVGVGTASPTAKMDVNDGEIRSTRVGYEDQQYLTIFGGDTTLTAPYLKASSRESNKKPLLFQSLHNGNGSAAGYL